MKKSVVLILLFSLILLLLVFQSASSQTKQEAIKKADQCIVDKIDDLKGGCSELSIEEKIFALFGAKECKNELLQDSQNQECFPASGCRLKSTAQAVLALDSAGSSPTKAQKWLMKQNISTNNLEWLLQIETNGPASCTITYKDSSFNINVKEDKTIDSGAGSCLSLDESGFWLEVSSSRSLGCFDNFYEISCDESFLTNLLFRKQGDDALNVLEKTNSASAGGTTTEKVNSTCFSQGGACSYEGSLWASLALSSVDEDVSSYLPYLIAFEDETENQKFLPSAFLYFLTSSNEFRQVILSKQKESKFWQESGDKFYDTAVALFPFKFEEPFEKQGAVNYLIETQDELGCWQGGVRNTGFLLASIGDAAPTPGTGELPDENACVDNGFFCRTSNGCLDDGGKVLDFDCPTPFRCCSVEKIEPTCSDLGGEICSSDEICSGGDIIDASDISSNQVCCFGGTCEKRQEENECILFRGECKASCDFSLEDEVSFSCDFSLEVCCVQKTTPPKPKGGVPWFIWFIVILIVLITLAIVFREKLRIFWIKLKDKFSKKSKGPGPPPSTGPPLPPRGPPPLYHPRRPNFLRAPKKPSSSKDVDEVLKRLKEMSR